MNLAPWRYRHAHVRHQGPIVDLVTRPIRNLSGAHEYEACATLSPDILKRQGTDLIYGNVDGTGTATLKSHACHKAISEALEKWACYSVRKSPEASKYGFTIDPNTSGMAAYPGFTSRQARYSALLEAVERWTIASWWERRIAHKELYCKYEGVRQFRLQPHFGAIETVLLAGHSNRFKMACYAFASADSIELAVERAAVELERNQRVLDFFIEAKGKPVADVSSEIGKLNKVTEQRLLYFSTDAGVSMFLERAESNDVVPIFESPRLIVDSEVPGPWSKYATVWRCLFQPLSERHLSEDWTFFLF
jgi:hypothetical protein